MDRRTFIRDTTGGAMLWVAPFAVRARARPAEFIPTTDVSQASVAVFDLSLVRGRRLARAALRRAIPAFALETGAADIGALWHAQIAPRVTRDMTLAAALRPSDAFVLARLAATRGCRLIGT